MLFWLWFAVIETNGVTEEVPGVGLFLTINDPPHQSKLRVVLLSLEGNQWLGIRRQGCDDV